VESPGWFESIESSSLLPFPSKFAQIFVLLLSSPAATTVSQGMGRKTFLLSLLGLLLISCECLNGSVMLFQLLLHGEILRYAGSVAVVTTAINFLFYGFVYYLNRLKNFYLL